MDKGLSSRIYFLFLIGIYLTQTVFSVRILKLGLSNGVIPEKGSDISMTCNFIISSDDGVQKLNVLKGKNKIADCILYEGGNLPCSKLAGVSSRYSFKNSQSSVIITVKNVQTSDAGNWYCGFQTTSNTLYNLIVYSSPSNLMLNGSSQPEDLSVRGVDFVCKTSNCVFPSPRNIQWFYKEADSWYLFKNSTVKPSHSKCNDSEKVYSSTLSLVKNTVWPLQPTNADITVNFQCRLDFPTLKSPLRSTETTEVKFAVRITSVSLQVDGRSPSSSDLLTVISGTHTRFSCLPSISRPPATVVWYIGSAIQQKNKSTEFIYIARYEDNDKQIYCKGFNIQGEENAVSSNAPNLHVFEKAEIQTFLAKGITDETVIVNETDTIQLECSVRSDPSSYIEIRFKDEILKSQENTRKLIYLLEDSTCLDTGVYTCSTTNEYNYGNKSEQELKVNIRCSPRPLYSVKENYTTSLHRAVTLSFTTLAYPEPGKKGFIWHKKNRFAWTPLLGNTHLQITSSGQQTNLTIQNVTESDYGYYRVTATNELGTYDQYMTLLEKDKSDTRKQSSDNSTLIVSVVLGLLVVALALYAVIVTIKLRRKEHPQEEPRRSMNTLKTKTTYGNVSYENDATGQHESDNQHYYTNAASEDCDKSMQEYTDLVRCSTDDQKTYAVIQKR